MLQLQFPAAPGTRRVLGIDFFVGSLDEGVSHALTRGGLVVAPSGPGLAVDLVSSPAYRAALHSANLAIPDSGWMVLLWWLLTGERLPRHSGLAFIRAVLERPELKKPGAVFWVMPSAEEDARNRRWLEEQGFPVTADDVYIAPHYAHGAIHDEALLRRIEARRPQIVMLAIGGGVQERLGHALWESLSRIQEVDRPALGGQSRPAGAAAELSTSDGQSSSAVLRHPPAILCLGAAIAFLTGGQADIPQWADKAMMGWLLRILHSPGKFWRRYWNALQLAPLLWRWRERAPIGEA